MGACVGPRGSRVRMVNSELRGEKIDIIPFNEEPPGSWPRRLPGARARGARGRRRQAGHGDRARRPALAGDRQGRPERAARGSAHGLARGHPLGDGVRRGGGGDAVRGGGGAVRALRRDPRQRQALPQRALAGSRYCGLPAHQELADKDTDYVVPPDEAATAASPSPKRSPPRRSPPGRSRRAPRRPHRRRRPPPREPELPVGDGAEPVPETTAENELEPNRGGQG